MGGDEGAVFCCFFLFSIVAVIGIGMAISAAKLAAAHKDFLVQSSAMETLASTLSESSMVRGLLVPHSKVNLYDDIVHNFKVAHHF